MNPLDDKFQNFILSVYLVTCGSGLLIAGFTVDPTGQIHPSVLTAFGEILCFVGALIGIDYHRSKNK